MDEDLEEKPLRKRANDRQSYLKSSALKMRYAKEKLEKMSRKKKRNNRERTVSHMKHQ